MTETTVDTAYDVIVVGGGPAGATTAGLLTKKGRRVLVLEKEHFPRYHIGESMITGMLSVVNELGLFEKLDSMGWEQKHGLSLVWGKGRQLWPVRFVEAGPYEYSYHVERAGFDELFLRHAQELGAEVLEGVNVVGPVVDGDRVTGVRYEDPETSEERVATSRFVVDASGQARTISRHVDTLTWNKHLRQIAVWSYFDGCGRLPDGQETHILIEKEEVGGEGWFWAIPLGTTQMSVGLVVPTDVAKEADSLETLFWSKQKRTRELAKLMADSVQTSEFKSARDWSYMSDSFAGPGWASVGDAACFIDPLLSTGVCLGMLEASPLAQALDHALEHPQIESDLLKRYGDGCREFLSAMTKYVEFFYDSDRDQEDYFQLAQNMADPEKVGSPRHGFIAVVSGVSGLADVFPFDDLLPDSAGSV